MTPHDFFTLGLAVLISILGFLVQRQLKDYDKKLEAFDEKHRLHFQHATDIRMHETDRDRESASRERQAITNELIRHIERDDDRFDQMDRKIGEIAGDIKQILKAVGGNNGRPS